MACLIESSNWQLSSLLIQSTASAIIVSSFNNGVGVFITLLCLLFVQHDFNAAMFRAIQMLQFYLYTDLCNSNMCMGDYAGQLMKGLCQEMMQPIAPGVTPFYLSQCSHSASYRNMTVVFITNMVTKIMNTLVLNNMDLF